MNTYYETRSERTDNCGTGVEIDCYQSLESALVESLELWPEDADSDVLIYAMTEGHGDLVATIRHHDHDDPRRATVCIFSTTGRPDVAVSEFHCEYIELFGRIHTNITRVQE